ncbi:SGNH hydrolase [Streptomyces chrestomyceticus JCM 4735]|uniref:SGNH hydrolase n=1 Tax=Streptomyces chrestomyceticus JCM 4735 TaxID=1306181 RepID=A0A7U9KYZ9_9ACTN|nr:SGNH/GDSL hydrolase family protein [Streptomyces chrestomyceticus]GCD37411.1 SGNH hydrolase [Streptomyces chrestomyceticus JCM 4735]
MPTPVGRPLPSTSGLAALLVLAAVLLSSCGGGTQDSSGDDRPPSAERWAGTWSAAAAAAEPGKLDGYADTSIRNVVHTSIGGTSARIQLSNLYGTRPLSVGHATLARASAPGDPSAAPGTLRRLTFSGRPSVTVPAGGAVTSDPVRLTVPAAADLLVTTYSPAPSGPVTYHPHARQTSYLARGDRAADTAGGAYTRKVTAWRYLTGVDVLGPHTDGAVVAVGDSITDGNTSTPDANHRWPDFLAARLRTEPGAPRYGVLNQGISGNRLLTDSSRWSVSGGPSVLSRLERDVLSRAGVRAVVVEIGLNDLFKSPRRLDAEKLADGMREIVRRAAERDIQVIGSTLTPFGGHRGYRPELDTVRQALNAKIRAGEVYGQYADFDKALRDPHHPLRLRPVYDSGDHLHPSDAGYRAMADAVDLRQLKGAVKGAVKEAAEGTVERAARAAR